MKWTKQKDRWAAQSTRARYQVKWSGKRWLAYLNPFSANIMELQWRKVIGLYPTSKDAKQACQEHYNANEERVQPESHLVEHQERDEGGQAAEAGGSNRPVRRRKVKKEEVLTAQG
jgi:hypothetical protein